MKKKITATLTYDELVNLQKQITKTGCISFMMVESDSSTDKDGRYIIPEVGFITQRMPGVPYNAIARITTLC